MSTVIPTYKLRPAYYSNHQEAIPIEGRHIQAKINSLSFHSLSPFRICLLWSTKGAGTLPTPCLLPSQPLQGRKPCISPAEHLSTFFHCRFQHYDGALVINQMSIGGSIELCPKAGQSYDPESIALALQRRLIRLYPRRPEQLASHLISLWPQEHPRVPHSSSRQRSCSLGSRVRVGLIRSDIRPR